MADYTVVSVADVPDSAAAVGMDPDHFEIRFMREALGLQNFAVTYERLGGGWSAPQGHAHRRGHRQTVPQEGYSLVSVHAQARFAGEAGDVGAVRAGRVRQQRRPGCRAGW